MKIEDMVVEFYRRVVFGAGYRTQNNTNENYVGDLCFDNAWRDMARTLRPKEEYKSILGGKQNKETRSVEIELLKTEVKNCFNESLLTDFINQKLDVLKFIESVMCCNKTKIEFLFGQAQKVVNMFFKYFYTFKNDLKIPESCFDVCHCPVDNITLKRIYLLTKNSSQEIVKLVDKNQDKYKYISYNKNLISWSDLSKEEYENIQNVIDEINTYKTRLKFEFDWGIKEYML